MPRIINSTYITLDGVIEAPHRWPSIGGSDERFGQIQTDLLLSCDAVLMGRRTYDGFAPVWPTRSGDPLSDRMNEMPKYVVSTTLKDPEWNNTHVIDGDVVAEITRLRERSNRDIVQYGFGPVSRLLLEHGLLDELRLWIHPLILGSGSPSDLLFGAAPTVRFQLTDTMTLNNGIVVLTYQTEETGRLDEQGASSRTAARPRMDRAPGGRARQRARQSRDRPRQAVRGLGRSDAPRLPPRGIIAPWRPLL